MFRIGAKWWDTNNYKFDIVSKFLMSDTLNISYSIWDYLYNYDISYVNYPINILSHIIGLIPSFIFPSKNEYYIYYSDIGYYVLNLQGTTSSFVSIMINFGLIRTIFGHMLSIFVHIRNICLRSHEEMSTVIWDLYRTYIGPMYFI